MIKAAIIGMGIGINIMKLLKIINLQKLKLFVNLMKKIKQLRKNSRKKLLQVTKI